MWKEYSISYIKNNKISSISVLVASLIATLFLSLLCGLFYNFWTYDTDEILLEEGNWHGRISGQISEEDITIIENFPNVESVAVNIKLSNEQDTVIDIVFDNIRATYQDMSLIAEKVGVEESKVECHTLLLSQYLVHDPQDTTPPLLLAFYIFIMIVVCISLVMVIHNAFAVSMNARVQQFGIFSSVGATPKQIRKCLVQEALALSALPIVVGSLSGIGICYGLIQIENMVADGVAGRHAAVFYYHPLIFVATVVASFLTVFFSALIPARKLSKVTPLEAIRTTSGLKLKRRKRSPILSLMFGIEGELAGNALKAQKKALRTFTLSLTLSFFAFTVMLCFFTLSGISTNHTYFERYKDAWDIMITVKDTGIDSFALPEEIKSSDSVESVVVYRKANAMCEIDNGWISDELNKLGGVGAVAGSSVTTEGNSCFVKAPIIILDDQSFIDYCNRLGVSPQLEGTIVLNRIWDNINSNFRYKEFIPYVNEEHTVIKLSNLNMQDSTVELPVIFYTSEVPVLREEYDDYALVQFVSASGWEKISSTIGNVETDTYIRVLCEDGIEIAELNALEKSMVEPLGRTYSVESENRLQEKVTNDEMLNGYKVIIGAFCVMLAIIGIANLFSNTLGFLYLRRREFAQYMSVGMTPANIRKMFAIEVLVIAGRPILITLPLTVVFVEFMITSSYLNLMEFIRVAPYVPIILFMIGIVGFVSLAYYLGEKKVKRYSLAESLRDTLI